MNPLMVPTVAGDFMTGALDVSDQPRIGPCDLTEHEERGFDPAIFQSLQQVARRGLYAGAISRRQGGVDAHARRGFNSMVFLYVETQDDRLVVARVSIGSPRRRTPILEMIGHRCLALAGLTTIAAGQTCCFIR